MAWRLSSSCEAPRPLFTPVYQFGLASTNKTKQKYGFTKFKKDIDKIESSEEELKISRVERVWRKTYPKPSCLLCSQYTPEGWAADTTHTHTNGTDGLHT
jgi:hypothetical protein